MLRRRYGVVTSFIAAAIVAQITFADAIRHAVTWSTVSAPVASLPAAIGGINAGCLTGGISLRLLGTGYQVARPERNRNFGHADLLGVIENLGRAVAAANLGDLLIGDMSQPRGGPLPSGHSSHQSGLDADIFYATTLDAPPVVTLQTRKLTAQWTPRIPAILKFAASDPHVSRIFVNPSIKRELCRSVNDDRAWLQKIRPWWGHHEHFHLRLVCPTESTDCVTPRDLPPGDGCHELAWWFNAELQADRDKKIKRYEATLGSSGSLPESCQRLLATP